MMKKDITVTVATVVYNGAAIIAEAIESVIHQTYPHIEYIIVDGASKDNTVEIVRSYAERYPFIKLLSEPDKHIFDAMNKAQRLATGDFMLFIGCDDALYTNTTIEEFVGMVTDMSSTYYGDVMFTSTREIYLGAFSLEKLLLQNICHQAIFYPRVAYQHITYNMKYKQFADWDYNLKAWSQYGAFKRVELIVALYNEATGNSVTQDVVFFEDRIQLVKQYFGDKYTWLLNMQEFKKKLLGNTDLRKVKKFFFHKLK